MTADLDTIKTYRFIEELGAGAYGKVFRVEDLRDTKVYAMKIVEEKIDGVDDISGKSEERFLKALKGVRGVPVLHDSFSLEKKLCIITPLLLADLTHFMFISPQRRLEKRTIARIGCDLMNILKEIHDRGVVHRDIKPDNLMLGPTLDNAQLYLTDFGMAYRYATSGGMKIRSPRESYSFEVPIHSTPQMMLDNPCIPHDDVVMSLYTLVFLSGLRPFNEPTPTGRFFQKSSFMEEPEKVLKNENAWLVPFAKKVFEYEEEDNIDYDQLGHILTSSVTEPIDLTAPYQFRRDNGRVFLD